MAKNKTKPSKELRAGDHKAQDQGRRFQDHAAGGRPPTPRSRSRTAATGKTWDLPVLKGTIGPDVVDVRKLYTEHGLFTYDPGYGSTGSTQSAITYIDGEEGILMHRGYRIEELAAYVGLHGGLLPPARG